MPTCICPHSQCSRLRDCTQHARTGCQHGRRASLLGHAQSCSEGRQLHSLRGAICVPKTLDCSCQQVQRCTPRPGLASPVSQYGLSLALRVDHAGCTASEVRSTSPRPSTAAASRSSAAHLGPGSPALQTEARLARKLCPAALHDLWRQPIRRELVQAATRTGFVAHMS